MNVEIDGTPVDMSGDTLPAFSYAIADPYDPGGVKGSRSTTFKIPATNGAKAILGSDAMTEPTPSVDPTLSVGIGGQNFVSANIRPIEWERDEIRAVAVGGNAGWITKLKNLNIRSLNLGKSEKVDALMQRATWTASEDEILYFPLINYGKDWTSAVSMRVPDLRPGFRCANVLDAAFSSIGYTLKVKGSLNRVWKKFGMPAVDEPVPSADLIEGNTLEVIQSLGSGASLTVGGGITELPLSVQSTVDPGGNLTNVDRYTVPFQMRMRVRVRASIQTTIPSGFGILRFNVTINGGPVAIALLPSLQFTAGTNTYEYSALSAEFDSVAGQEYRLGCYLQDLSADTNLVVRSMEVTFEPVTIFYDEDVTIDIAKSLPDMNAMDVLKGLAMNRLLAFSTNDTTKVVEVSYWDDRYKNITYGESWAGREDYSDSAVKSDPLRERRIVYGWKSDSSDKALERLNDRVGERGWGGYIHENPAGKLDDKKITMPFAATAMGDFYLGVYAPIMTTHETGGTWTVKYKWAPRLLIFDGTIASRWAHDGDSLDVQPYAYFVARGETEKCLSFGPETIFGLCGPGTVSLYHARQLRRIETSMTLEIDLFIYDDELIDFDFGTPRLVRDGQGNEGWYYVQEIKQKRYGVHEPTRCELIQV